MTSSYLSRRHTDLLEPIRYSARPRLASSLTTTTNMPPRKKTRKAQDEPAKEPVQQAVRRNVRGRRGGLKDMPGMPLDILIEVGRAPARQSLLGD